MAKFIIEPKNGCVFPNGDDAIEEYTNVVVERLETGDEEDPVEIRIDIEGICDFHLTQEEADYLGRLLCLITKKESHQII